MKHIEIKCSGCENFFNKQLKEYTRQIKKGNSNFYCTPLCSSNHIFKKRKIHCSIERECLFCKQKFLSTTHKRHKKCCNKLCANKYAYLFVNKNKISNSMKKAWIRGDFSSLDKRNRDDKNKLIPIIYTFKCEICNNSFIKTSNKHLYKDQKTCSDLCLKKLISRNSTNNINCGGETNYKKFKYKNIWMDSSWELKIATWLDNNNIIWKRDRKIIFYWTDSENKKRRYYPDFYLPQYDIYLDPKNKFKLEKDRIKLNQVIKENDICLIYGLLSDVIQLLQTEINKKNSNGS